MSSENLNNEMKKIDIENYLIKRGFIKSNSPQKWNKVFVMNPNKKVTIFGTCIFIRPFTRFLINKINIYDKLNSTESNITPNYSVELGGEDELFIGSCSQLDLNAFEFFIDYLIDPKDGYIKLNNYLDSVLDNFSIKYSSILSKYNIFLGSKNVCVIDRRYKYDLTPFYFVSEFYDESYEIPVITIESNIIDRKTKYILHFYKNTELIKKIYTDKTLTEKALITALLNCEKFNNSRPKIADTVKLNSDVFNSGLYDKIVDFILGFGCFELEKSTGANFVCPKNKIVFNYEIYTCSLILFVSVKNSKTELFLVSDYEYHSTNSLTEKNYKDEIIHLFKESDVFGYLVGEGNNQTAETFFVIKKMRQIVSSKRIDTKKDDTWLDLSVLPKNKKKLLSDYSKIAFEHFLTQLKK